VRLESTFYYKSRVERRLTTQFEGDTPCCLYEDFPSLLLLFEIGPGRVESGWKERKKPPEWGIVLSSSLTPKKVALPLSRPAERAPNA